MRYKIIIDEKELTSFLNELPCESTDDKFYVSILARGKYGFNPELKNRKHQVRRFVARKHDIPSMLRELEIPLGEYKNYKTNTIIHNNSLVVYIRPTPINMKEATTELKFKLALNEKMNKTKDVVSLAMDSIHTSKNRKYSILDIDVDYTDKSKDFSKEIIDFMSNILNKESFCVVKTNGGVHINIIASRIDSKYKKTYFNNIKKLEGIIDVSVMFNEEGLVPLCGTIQGNTSPKLLKKYDE